MTFLRITREHSYLNRIYSWYINSFPSSERRTPDELNALLDCADMHLCALIDDNRPVGFIIYWQWNNVLFIEHFAIDPDQRGKQLGQQALTWLLRIEPEYVILEVERPVDEMSRRRIHFYERQGFLLNPFDYVQPPYQPGKPAVPMRLMSIPPIADEAEFIDLSKLIKERVYERFYR